MNQSRTQTLCRVLVALALCAVSIVPATATTTITSGIPIITSVQLNLPAADQITINGTGFGKSRPTITVGGTPLVVNERDFTRPVDLAIESHELRLLLTRYYVA